MEYNLITIPSDIIINITYFLDFRSLYNLFLTTKYIYSIIDNNILLWYHYLNRDFKNVTQDIQKTEYILNYNNLSYKRKYEICHLLFELINKMNIMKTKIYRNNLTVTTITNIENILEIFNESCFELKFNNIPLGIKYLKNLKEFDISNNEIKIINNDLCSMKNLIKLRMSKNKITEIPEEFYELQNLEVLVIDN